MVAPTCSLLKPQDGHCWRCEKPLPKYRRRWCSDECGKWYADQHVWAFARGEVLKRDNYTCQTCGFHTTNTGPPDIAVRLRGKELWDNWLEVNHIKPRNGMGYLSGCHNHWDNLETLCKRCHVKVTNQQRQERQAAKLLANGAGYAMKLPGMEYAE